MRRNSVFILPIIGESADHLPTSDFMRSNAVDPL
jgi:hypothetical protein